MKYNLVATQNSQSQIIKGFSKIPGFEYLNENSLKDIVNFTMHFTNEDDLKEYLQEANLYSLNTRSTIKIAMIKGQNKTLLPFPIPYQNDAYLFNEENLTRYFIKHMDNIKFMDAFLFHFYKKYQNVPFLGDYLAIINVNHQKYKNNGNILMGEKTALEDFIHHYLNPRNKDGIHEFNFRHLYDLATFVINYQRINEPIMVDTEKEEIMKITDAIRHYRLLLYNNHDEEAQRYYEKEIANLEGILEELQLTKERRRHRHDIT